MEVSIGTISRGKTIKIGERKYIVLNHNTNTHLTAIITKYPVKRMRFEEADECCITDDYNISNVRKFCNNEFLNELAATIGINNIITHDVNLTAEDGTGKGKSCQDKVSILTTDSYRRYREFIGILGDLWWTATKISYISEDYEDCLCYVNNNGVLEPYGTFNYLGIHPYCIIKSSVMVTPI